MITAMQSARQKAANSLSSARGSVVELRSLVCWTTGEEMNDIESIVQQIDALYAKLIPNSPVA